MASACSLILELQSPSHDFFSDSFQATLLFSSSTLVVRPNIILQLQLRFFIFAIGNIARTVSNYARYHGLAPPLQRRWRMVIEFSKITNRREVCCLHSKEPMIGSCSFRQQWQINLQRKSGGNMSKDYKQFHELHYNRYY
jgi:hypothetical protein